MDTKKTDKKVDQTQPNLPADALARNASHNDASGMHQALQAGADRPLDEVVTADTGVMRTFSDKKSGKNMNVKIITVLFIVVLLGLGSGYALSIKNGASDNNGKISLLGAEKGKIFGSESTEGFDDPAEGVIKKGGIDGEGAYHMERPGGETQTVYLTSSSVDLGQFVNKKVRVWGESQDAQQAGWLLDVGRLEVL